MMVQHLDHSDVDATARQLQGSRKSGDTCADNKYIMVVFFAYHTFSRG
jgi:hypothetical protein